VLLKRDLSGPIATRVLGPVARELRQVSAALSAASPPLPSSPPSPPLPAQGKYMKVVMMASRTV